VFSEHKAFELFNSEKGGHSDMLLTMVIAAQVAASIPKASETPSAEVSHKGNTWQVDYTLPHDATAWVFPVSAPKQIDHRPWRQGAWKVVTPGVRIERHGAYDMLVASNGRSIPHKVRINFNPTSATLEREYDPAIAFSNGATALYSDQFDVAPIDDPATVDAREAGLTVQDFGGRSVPVRFHDDGGPVFVQGRRQNDPTLAGAATYVVFGSGEVQTIKGVAMLADPALPRWLTTDVSQFAPRVASTYASRLGARSDPRLPLLIMGWRGATSGKVINDGGVRPGEIVLNFEGEGLLERNERAARRTRWFIAHEIAHFWLGSEGVGYVMPSDAWITEGGAEMMAFTLLATVNHEYVLGELQRAVDDCVKLGTKPIAQAADRHESRAFYACGTVFALASSGVARRRGGSDFFDFIKPLLARHQSDRHLGSAEWLGHFATLAGKPGAANVIRSMIEHGSSQPVKDIETILKSADVPMNVVGNAIVLGSSAI
jgi:hypothetical protein